MIYFDIITTGLFKILVLIAIKVNNNKIDSVKSLEQNNPNLLQLKNLKNLV